MRGELTIKGVTRRSNLDVELPRPRRRPVGQRPCRVQRRGRINREDWGLTWNMLLEAGGLLVSKEITLEIDVELIRDPA